MKKRSDGRAKTKDTPAQESRAASTGSRGEMSRSRRFRLFWHRNRIVLRSCFLCAVIFGLIQALMEWGAPATWDFLNTATANLTAWSLWLVGAGGKAHGDVVTSSVLPLKIIGTCTGAHLLAMHSAAVLAYPCRWRAKLLGIALGVPAILLVNQIRLVSLCYIGRSYPDLFDTAHLIVWQSLMIFSTVLIWLLWATSLVRNNEPTPA